MKKKLHIAALFLLLLLTACGRKNAITEYHIHTDLQAKYLNDNYKNFVAYAKGAEELSRPQNIVIKTDGKTDFLLYSEYEDFRNSRKLEASGNEFVFSNLKVGTTYYYKIDQDNKVYSFKTSNQAPRNLSIDGVTNVRDLGGWKLEKGSVKQGLIFRSAKFNKDESDSPVISENGIASMLYTLGIKTELDLRGTENNENGGISESPLGKGVNYVSIPFQSGGNILLLNRDSLKELFQVFGDSTNYPIVFHCSIGTDRTGLVAFLINGLLGVSEEDLYRDFLFSNFAEIGKMRTPSIIDTYLNTVKSAGGNSLSEKIYNYLLAAGVEAGDLDNLIEYMTQGLPTVTTDENVSLSEPKWQESYIPAPSEEGDIKLIHISDIHYYSKRLTDCGELYTQVMEAAAGRDGLHLDEILEAFRLEMAVEKPDAIIVSGDLSMNGEKKSHEDLAAYFSGLEKDGYPVYVIPGNHDINSENTFAISDSGSTMAESTSPADFEDIYEEFGFAEAFSRDTESLSYAIELNDRLLLLMLDTCIYAPSVKNAGYLSNASKEWIYELTANARAKGQEVITVTHQNSLSHNEFADEDYTIINSNRYVYELMQLGVRLNLSGHMHCMNIADEKETYYDVALSSLAVWPNLYGRVDLRRDGRMSYSAHRVEHENSSYNYLIKANSGKLAKAAEEAAADSAVIQKMKEFITNLNSTYFAGNFKVGDELMAEEGYKLWEKYLPESKRFFYIQAIAASKRGNHTFISEEMLDRN